MDYLFEPPHKKTLKLYKMVLLGKLSTVEMMFMKHYTPNIIMVNVYVAFPVFTPVAGSSYAHFMEKNGSAQYVSSYYSEFGRYFHFFLVLINTI